MKRDVRFLGIDDSPFRFTDARSRLVGVVTRGASYVEGVLTASVEVDGEDGTQVVIDMLSRSRFRALLRAIFLNGVTVAGFNVLDLDRLHAAAGVPVIAVVRRKPDQEASERALVKHFPDGGTRARQLRAVAPVEVLNGPYRVWACARGVELGQIPSILAAATVRRAIPEPVRLAHVIASGLARGESRGPV